ncbi:uncharacterized protein G2W53_026788 [Senna tora]|uniref:Uncharacterized protein n=1 Tax=Senna tora TaxID=362788 RepID=A0A834TFW6_9FABA|nr:uncharacterized protein G2W53_026788 [Senna tora]
MGNGGNRQMRKNYYSEEIIL